MAKATRHLGLNPRALGTNPRMMETNPRKVRERQEVWDQGYHPNRTRSFFRSAAWAKARWIALERANGRCRVCGRSAADGVRLNVDHIKPRMKYPHLALAQKNLAVLCALCNWGKGDRDRWNYSQKSEKRS